MALVVLGAAAAAQVAAASSLPLTTAKLGAGRVAVPRCAVAATGSQLNQSGGSIVSVTVSNLGASCQGETISVAVTNGTVWGTGSATVPAAASLTVTLTPVVAYAAAMQTDLVVSGR